VLSLETRLKFAVNAHAAKQLATRDLVTVRDLLWFLPRRYLDRQTDLGSLRPGESASFVGEVTSVSVRPMKQRRGKMLTALVRTSGGQQIEVTFFSAYGHEGRLKPGVHGVFAGKVERFRDRWQLAHPAYETFGDQGPDKLARLAALEVGEADPAVPAGASDDDPPAAPGDFDAWFDAQVFPVYLEIPRLPSFTISRLVEQVLLLLDEPPDPVPAEVRRARGLPTFTEAMRLVHRPADHAEHRRGMAALKYAEAFVLQTVLAKRRAEQARAVAIPRQQAPDGLLAVFDERLPFALTPGQERVGAEIFADLAQRHPMNRLLQGEVGSGKTVVALRAMLAVIDAGGQAALLAPTEVLAAQHHRSLTAMLGDLALGGMLGGAQNATRVVLLTGSQSAAERKAALVEAAAGTAGIVVGTHALIQDRVTFADLALAVIDEQHRFGVEQRDQLRTKAGADRSPHVLVMTATPIPRTVAMTVFGDMDTSVLDEVPPGRSPIASHVVDNARWYERAWERVAEEVRKGHQAYVVCPRIGEPGEGDEGADGASIYREIPTADLDLDPDAEPPRLTLIEGGGGREERRPMRGVVEVLAELRATPALAGLRLEMLHGKLSPERKDAVMTAFARGEIDVLVSTTVIEVGVDVANATAMVILDADRFGVSQLHQLRGRVGRGAAPGLCLLVTESEAEPARDRLAAVAATLDGFELSRLDLQQRREGDVLGARQAGMRSSLRVLKVRFDEDLITQAREDAVALIDADPGLQRHPVLAEAAEEMLDGERAAFLERG
jgi:ATP-dependent DNA helicase RecG